MSGQIYIARRFSTLTFLSIVLGVVAGCSAPVQEVSESTETEPIPNDRVHAQLVTDVTQVASGETFRVGVLFNIPDRSHIYWRNPGASGLPTGVEWTLPEGIEVGELQWPAPKRFEVEGWDEVSFGYESKVLLFTEFRVPKSIANTELISIAARAYWLNCEEDGQCIPGDAELQLEIPIRSESKPSSYEVQFEQSRLRAPVPLVVGSLPVWIVRADGKTFFALLERDGARIMADGVDGLDFFPYEGEAWTHDRFTSERATGNFPSFPLDDRINTSGFNFVPPDDEAVQSGVLVFSVEREDSETPQTFYISMED